MSCKPMESQVFYHQERLVVKCHHLADHLNWVIFFAGPLLMSQTRALSKLVWLDIWFFNAFLALPDVLPWCSATLCALFIFVCSYVTKLIKIETLKFGIHVLFDYFIYFIFNFTNSFLKRNKRTYFSQLERTKTAITAYYTRPSRCCCK